MHITTFRRFEFSASRRLLNGKLHGNNFYGWAGVSGEVDPANGMLINVTTLKQIIHRILERYDHLNLNNSLGLEDANTVAVAQMLWADLTRELPVDVHLTALELAEMDEHAALLNGKSSWFVGRGGFSAAHRTHAPQLSAAENLQMYGICNNPAGHGHNYRVEIGLPPGAPFDPSILADFDHRNLSVDLPEFAGRNVVTEAIAHSLALREPLADWVRVWETPDFYAEYWPMKQVYRLGRRYRFHAAHRLDSPHLSREENQLLYGKCNRPDPHGHTYIAQVSVQGEMDRRTGAAYDLGCLDQVALEVLAPLDYTYLDEEVEAFAGRPTTGENIAAFLHEQFESRLGSALKSVRLWETANNQFAASRDD